MKKIVIDPVTRIEGHAKITINVDDNGKVDDAKLHVTQYRGFEKFCEGRQYTEMPGLTARTCGICPVSHLISSSKACDELLAVRPPKGGRNLRRIINLGQILQSHALNFFHLSAADMLYGFDAPKEERNIFQMMKTNPEMAKNGIELRAFGQKVIESLAGKRIHPAWIVPGGVSHQISQEQKDTIVNEIPKALEIVKNALIWYKEQLPKYKKEIEFFGNYKSMFMGLVNKDGNLEHYDGKLRFMDWDGTILEDGVDPKDYKKYIGEYVENFSFLKSPYYKPRGYENGMYRVGPLARLNIANRCGTPLADQALEDFKALNNGKPVLNNFYYHYARLIEITYCIERIEELLNQPETMSDNIRSHANINRFRGVGCSEAPRGTLFHEYTTDKHGTVESVNMIIASGNNNLAMNAGIKQAAKEFVDGTNPKDGDLNRVEAVIRCFDPCLSCSTHALGVVATKVEIKNRAGETIKLINRV